MSRPGALLEESVALNRRLGDEGMIAVESYNLGHVEIHRGNVDAAARHVGVARRLGLGVDPYGVALAHLGGAVVAFARGDADRARTLLGAIDSTLAESGTGLASDDLFELEHVRRELAAPH